MSALRPSSASLEYIATISDTSVILYLQNRTRADGQQAVNHKRLPIGPRAYDHSHDPGAIGDLDDLVRPSSIERLEVAAPTFDDESLERDFVAIIETDDDVFAVRCSEPWVRFAN
jgi:hypothetical protein